MKKILFLILTSGPAYAQVDNDSTTTKRQVSLLVGYNGFKYQFLELGIAGNNVEIYRQHATAVTYFASAEIMIDKDPVIGPKVGIWLGNSLVLGLNAIYYTNNNEGSLQLRPELGIGLSTFKVVYGYNAAITNKQFDRINKHMLSLAYTPRIVKLKDRRGIH